MDIHILIPLWDTKYIRSGKGISVHNLQTVLMER